MLEQLHCRRPVDGVLDRVSLIAKMQRDDLGDVAVVFDEEDPFRRGHASAIVTPLGSRSITKRLTVREDLGTRRAAPSEFMGIPDGRFRDGRDAAGLGEDGGFHDATGPRGCRRARRPS